MRSFIGKVVSNRMQKSVVVAVDRFKAHSKYPKVVRTTKKFMAHDESNECSIGDQVSAWEVASALTRLVQSSRRETAQEIVAGTAFA